MKKISLYFIVFYQKILSPDTGILGTNLFRGKTCGMYPTCSEYTKQAIQKHGFLKGWYLGFKRIFRCSPKNQGVVDLVP